MQIIFPPSGRPQFVHSARAPDFSMVLSEHAAQLTTSAPAAPNFKKQLRARRDELQWLSIGGFHSKTPAEPRKSRRIDDRVKKSIAGGIAGEPRHAQAARHTDVSE